MALNFKEGYMCCEFDIDVAFETRLGLKLCTPESNKASYV